jgi:uncharacterized membrane-anchored protein
VLTDFHLHDGFSHFLLLDKGFTPRQAGRIAQRLVEIETYRVMALLAFPVAKDTGRLVSRAEDELADLMDGMGRSRSAEDDRAVLARLSRLAAEVERSVARTTFRFGAAAAYYRLVRQRIDDLREQRLPGFSPIGEFMDRRLVPAIDTCDLDRAPPGRPLRPHRTQLAAAAHPRRHRDRAPEPGAARADEPPRQDPAPPSGDR